MAASGITFCSPVKAVSLGGVTVWPDTVSPRTFVVESVGAIVVGATLVEPDVCVVVCPVVVPVVVADVPVVVPVVVSVVEDVVEPVVVPVVASVVVTDVVLDMVPVVVWLV